MLSIIGTLKNGHVTFDKEIKTKKSIKVIITFLDDIDLPDKKSLSLSDFSFSKSKKLLKRFKGSFSDTVVEERRNEL